MKIIAIIPARFASTRFPGKPLAMIGDKSMIQRVYHRISQIPAISRTVVATDDDRILGHVKSFGGTALLTSTSHPSGTDRCAEASDLIGAGENDLIINVQGDEPFILPRQIDHLISLFNDEVVGIGTLMEPIESTEKLLNPNIVKVINDKNGRAIYFSRTAIPYLNKTKIPEWPERFSFNRHLGIYGFRKKILDELVKLEVSPLEKAESLEQLRWMENGHSIYLKSTESMGPAIDTPEDLEQARIFIENNPSFK